MLNVDLDHASERRLALEARNRGLTVESYASLLLQAAINDPRNAPGDSLAKSDEDWERELDDLIEDQDPSIPPIPDEALTRESLYEDRA